MMRKDDVLRRTGTDWVVEGVTIACVVAILVSFGFYGHIDADEAFPMHYNAAGEVDGWGTRSGPFFLGGLPSLYLSVCQVRTCRSAKSVLGGLPRGYPKVPCPLSSSSSPPGMDSLTSPTTKFVSIVTVRVFLSR